MKKSFIILLLITSLFISCNPEVYIEEETNPPVEEIERDIISNLANKYIELIDVEAILSDSINATSVKSDTISVVSKPVVKEDSIVFTVEFLGSNKEEVPAKRDVVQLTDEISDIRELKGFLTISLDGLTINADGTKKFLTYSYKLSNPSIDKPLVISDDKNRDVQVFLHETFGGDVFAELSITENYLDNCEQLAIISKEVIATPMLPINDSYLLVNWNESKIDDISKTPEVLDKQELIKTKIAEIEIPYIAKDLLATFREEQLRYSIATLHKEIGDIDKGQLSDNQKNKAKEINKQPHIGVADYIFMNRKGNIDQIALEGSVGIGWLTPMISDFISSSGLKMNGLYIEIRQSEEGTKTGDVIIDLTFMDDTRQYFKNGKAKIKAGSRIFIAMKDCTFGYMGSGVDSGDNMKLTAKKYNISTSPNELFNNFKSHQEFAMPEQGSIQIDYMNKTHSIQINNMEGESNIYMGIDFIMWDGFGIKTTLELNSIGTPTSYDLTFDGQSITSTTTL